MRQPANWMRPMDDRILEVLQMAGIPLSPSIIAYNIDMSREAVNRRSAELAERGLVEKIKCSRHEIAHLNSILLMNSLPSRTSELISP